MFRLPITRRLASSAFGLQKFQPSRNFTVAVEAPAITFNSSPLALSSSIRALRSTVLANTRTLVDDIATALQEAILNIKRTFQPSLLVRKRRCGYLARAADRNGRKVLNRRKAKGRTRLCG